MYFKYKIYVVYKLAFFSLMTLLCASCETQPYLDDTYQISGFVSGELVADGFKIVSQSGEVLEVTGRQFSFEKELRIGESYSVSIAEQPDVQICKVQNGAGVVLRKNVDDIEVRCRSWRTEKTIFRRTSSQTTEIVFGKDDLRHTIAVWQQEGNEEESGIWANLYEEGIDFWFEPKRLSNAASATSINPQLSSRLDREFYVVWEEVDSGVNAESRIFFTRHNSSDGTQLPQVVSAASVDATEPRIASNDQGDVIVLWLQSQAEDNTKRVFYSVTDPESGWGWSDPKIVNDGVVNGDASDIQVAMYPNGDAVAVWLEPDANNVKQVRTNFYTADKDRWLEQSFHINSEESTDAFSPELTADGNGNVLVAWVQQGIDKNTLSVWVNTYSPLVSENGWGEAEEIEVENAGNVVADSPMVMAYKSTQAMIVWSQDDGVGTNRIWAITHKPDGNWQASALSDIRSAEFVEDAEQPQIAQDGDGNVIVVWRQSIAGKKTIWANIYTPISGWGTPVQIDDDSADDSTQPLIAMGQSGHAMAIWRKVNSGDLVSNLFE